nr:immunoglobulin light chain junction region [Macaca mulatta]
DYSCAAWDDRLSSYIF